MERNFYRLARLDGLLKQIGAELDEMGPTRFWKGPGEREQKAREAFMAYFFIFGISKLTKMEWWHLQKPDVRFPDFQIASFGGNFNAPEIYLREFEQVIIPERCKDFEEAYSIVREKFNKYGLSDNDAVNLLIFVNHVESESWTRQLISKIGRYKPYREVWATYLLFKHDEIYATRSVRIRPMDSFKQVVVGFSEAKEFTHPPVPDYFRMNVEGLYEIKPEFSLEIRKRALRKKLGK